MEEELDDDEVNCPDTTNCNCSISKARKKSVTGHRNEDHNGHHMTVRLLLLLLLLPPWVFDR